MLEFLLLSGNFVTSPAQPCHVALANAGTNFELTKSCNFPTCLLFGLGTVGVVDDESPSEARPHGLLGNQFQLLAVLRIQLKHGTCATGLQDTHKIS